MRKADISPGKTLAVPYDLYGAFNYVTIRVRARAAAPVDAYLVNEAGFTQYQQGLGFSSWIGATGRHDHQLSKVLPSGKWFLLIHNPATNRQVTVDYELSTAPWNPPPSPESGVTGSFG